MISIFLRTDTRIRSNQAKKCAVLFKTWNIKDKKRGCDKIVWQPQYIGGFDGSGITVRVPGCVND